jgi:hypothetical protein
MGDNNVDGDGGGVDGDGSGGNSPYGRVLKQRLMSPKLLGGGGEAVELFLEKH